MKHHMKIEYEGDRSAAEEYLAKTENLSHFLLTLINDILDMSRIESGKVQKIFVKAVTPDHAVVFFAKMKR